MPRRPNDTEEKFCIQQDLRMGGVLLFFPLGSYLWGSQGDPGSSSLPLHSYLLSFPLLSLRAPCLPSSSSPSLGFIHLLFQEALAPPKPQAPPALCGVAERLLLTLSGWRELRHILSPGSPKGC